MFPTGLLFPRPPFFSFENAQQQINAEKSPFLVERLKIWMLPTLALIKSEKTVDYVVGFDDMGGRDDFPTEALRLRLAAPGIILYDGDEAEARAKAASAAAGGAGPAKRNMRTGGRGTALGSDDESSDFED